MTVAVESVSVEAAGTSLMLTHPSSCRILF
jgi:hypothetical protein